MKIPRICAVSFQVSQPLRKYDFYILLPKKMWEQTKLKVKFDIFTIVECLDLYVSRIMNYTAAVKSLKGKYKDIWLCVDDFVAVMLLTTCRNANVKKSITLLLAIIEASD